MKYLVAILFIACSIACATLFADDAKPSTEETSIRKVLDDQIAAWNKGDLPTFMAGYWNSKDLTFYTGKDKHQGWNKAFERYKKRYQNDGKEMGKLAFAELEVQCIGPDFAIVKGRWNVKMTNETLDGLFTLVMQKTDKGWVIIHDHTSA